MDRFLSPNIDDVAQASKYSPLLFRAFKEAFSFNDSQAAYAVGLAMAVCPHCWDAPRGCQCNNDE